ncbi:uncharacterized protein RSE6_10743 [Rhynchosporium secalis]|uniref:Uncharacterized protein n=1 Tax=Rhynchosporium secalis TaxID=38038 RepID=A0A1E1MLA0_RHYSE|nr:uncharacterized protein RSE6_10743 [Rhynchosporium secalis]
MLIFSNGAEFSLDENDHHGITLHSTVEVRRSEVVIVFLCTAPVLAAKYLGQGPGLAGLAQDTSSPYEAWM